MAVNTQTLIKRLSQLESDRSRYKQEMERAKDHKTMINVQHVLNTTDDRILNIRIKLGDIDGDE